MLCSGGLGAEETNIPWEITDPALDIKCQNKKKIKKSISIDLIYGILNRKIDGRNKFL